MNMKVFGWLEGNKTQYWGDISLEKLLPLLKDCKWASREECKTINKLAERL